MIKINDTKMKYKQKFRKLTTIYIYFTFVYYFYLKLNFLKRNMCDKYKF